MEFMEKIDNIIVVIIAPHHNKLYELIKYNPLAVSSINKITIGIIIILFFIFLKIIFSAPAYYYLNQRLTMLSLLLTNVFGW